MYYLSPWGACGLFCVIDECGQAWQLWVCCDGEFRVAGCVLPRGVYYTEGDGGCTGAAAPGEGQTVSWTLHA